MPGASPVGRFPRSERVRKRREFEAAQHAGRRVTTSHFVLLVYGRDEGGVARLGIVASRRIGSAVTRNRAKRLVREAFRSTRDLLEPGIDLVVIVKRPLLGMKLVDVVGEWRSASTAIARRSVDARRDRDARAKAPASVDSGNRRAP